MYIFNGNIVVLFSRLQPIKSQTVLNSYYDFLMYNVYITSSWSVGLTELKCQFDFLGILTRTLNSPTKDI